MKKFRNRMNRVPTSLVLTAGLFVWAINPAIAMADESGARPNIVLILADDLGYGDLSCYGQTDYQTPFIDRLADDLYADVIREMDGSVGEIRAALEHAGILGLTILIFMSDNGPSWGGSTGGLKGRKATAWEGGVRVPFIIRYPSKLPSGLKVFTPLWSLDVFPTLLEMAEIPLPEDLVLDGDDILPVLTGEKSVHRPIFTSHNEKIITVREEKWKLYLNQPHFQRSGDIASKARIDPRPDGENIIAPEEQPGPRQYPGLVPEPMANPLPLFDLASDPGETIDLADKHPHVVRRLKLSYQEFIDSMPD